MENKCIHHESSQCERRLKHQTQHNGIYNTCVIPDMQYKGKAIWNATEKDCGASCSTIHHHNDAVFTVEVYIISWQPDDIQKLLPIARTKTTANGKSSKKPLSITCSSENNRQTQFETSWTNGLCYDDNRSWMITMSPRSAFTVRPLVLCYSTVLWRAYSKVWRTSHLLFDYIAGGETRRNWSLKIILLISKIRYGFGLIYTSDGNINHWPPQTKTPRRVCRTVRGPDMSASATGNKTTAINSLGQEFNNLQNSFKNQQKK